MHESNNFQVFAKLVAISIVGGVAKALFSQPRQSSGVGEAVVRNLSETAAKKTSSSRG